MLMQEVWKPVPGFVGIYEVSDQGSVRCMRARQGVTVGKILKGKTNKDGYVRVVLNNSPAAPKDMLVHVLVLSAFKGPRPEGKESRHLNGVPDDNRLDNLDWGTPVENAADRALHGTQVRGEKHSHAKLTDAQVQEIRASDLPQKQLGQAYGVTQQTISDIKTGRRRNKG